MQIRLPNLTNALVYTGIVALVFSVFVPEFTADRAARVETRAEEAARALLEVGVANRPTNYADEAGRDALLEAFRARCAELGHPSSYLPTAHELPESLAGLDCLAFESKHYAFMLARVVDEVRTTPDGPVTDREGLAVYAWPLTLNPPGHTAFYVPEHGAAAFTRNLMHQYVGWVTDSRRKLAQPRPNSGAPRRPPKRRDYRGNDDERWILFLE